MQPSEAWLTSLDFCLIVLSDGKLDRDSFSPERLARAYKDCPNRAYNQLVIIAGELVLEFQA